MNASSKDLLTTLKSHAVFKVATIYIISGWLLIQFADISLEAFDAPSWVMRLFLIVVLTCLPIALIVSWLVNRANLGGATNTVIAAISIGVALVVAAWTYWDWTVGNETRVIAAGQDSVDQRLDDGAVLSRSTNPVIAVLPFSNMSSDTENDYLADGMTEDVITLLAQAPGLEVVARNSTFKYKDSNPDIRDVGRDLGADYVVEGSIRPIGERLRVTLQVIDAGNGSHVWAEKYDRPMDDFFDIQDEVTIGVAAAVGDAVFRTEYQAINQSRTENLSAWALTSQADVSLNTAVFGKADIEAARRAIELDPEYALAYAVLGRSLSFYTTFFSNEPLDDNPALAEAEAMARKARMLAPNDPKVLAYLAITLLWTGQPELALPIAKRVPQISPSYAEGLAYYGDILIHNGFPADAVPPLLKAIRLTPNALQLGLYNVMLGEAYIAQSDWTKAAGYLREAIREYGGRYSYAGMYLAGVELQMGRRDEAEALLKSSSSGSDKISLKRGEMVMKFYSVNDGGEYFGLLFNDLIALQKDLELRSETP